YETWNEDVLVILQIETASAFESVEEIAAVPGVDVLFIGPNDLSAALGMFQDFNNPEFKAAVDRIRKAAEANNIGVGYMCGDAESVLAKVDEGFTFLAAGTDARLISAGAAQTYKAIRDGIAARGK
ncbi:MAG: aldolase/citrate lyase family protein, partial [Limnochordia bacterium]